MKHIVSRLKKEEVFSYKGLVVIETIALIVLFLFYILRKSSNGLKEFSPDGFSPEDGVLALNKINSASVKESVVLRNGRHAYVLSKKPVIFPNGLYVYKAKEAAYVKKVVCKDKQLHISRDVFKKIADEVKFCTIDNDKHLNLFQNYTLDQGQIKQVVKDSTTQRWSVREDDGTTKAVIDTPIFNTQTRSKQLVELFTQFQKHCPELAHEFEGIMTTAKFWAEPQNWFRAAKVVAHYMSMCTHKDDSHKDGSCLSLIDTLISALGSGAKWPDTSAVSWEQIDNMAEWFFSKNGGLKGILWLFRHDIKKEIVKIVLSDSGGDYISDASFGTCSTDKQCERIYYDKDNARKYMEPKCVNNRCVFEERSHECTLYPSSFYQNCGMTMNPHYLDEKGHPKVASIPKGPTKSFYYACKGRCGGASSKDCVDQFGDITPSSYACTESECGDPGGTQTPSFCPWSNTSSQCGISEDGACNKWWQFAMCEENCVLKTTDTSVSIYKCDELLLAISDKDKFQDIVSVVTTLLMQSTALMPPGLGPVMQKLLKAAMGIEDVLQWLLAEITDVCYNYTCENNNKTTICDKMWVLTALSRKPQDNDANITVKYKTLTAWFEVANTFQISDKKLSELLTKSNKNELEDMSQTPFIEIKNTFYSLRQCGSKDTTKTAPCYCQPKDIAEEELIFRACDPNTVFDKDCNKAEDGPQGRCIIADGVNKPNIGWFAETKVMDNKAEESICG